MPDREKVIKWLEFTKAMITFNPSTGEEIEPENLNELNKTTYDACVGAIALLQEQEHKDRMFHALEDDWKRLKELLKDQEAQKQSILKNIADNQLANSPDEWQSPEQQMYSKGVFDGLQIAYEMLAYGVVKKDA